MTENWRDLTDNPNLTSISCLKHTLTNAGSNIPRSRTGDRRRSCTSPPCKKSCHWAYSYELIVRAPSLGPRGAACDNCKAMKNQQDHRPRRSTTAWLARVATTLRPTRTGAPVVAIGRAKTGNDPTFVIAEAP